jgi:hypothetical protein
MDLLLPAGLILLLALLIVVLLWGKKGKASHQALPASAHPEEEKKAAPAPYASAP